MLKCPSCGGNENTVTNRRNHKKGVRRRRECSACGARYSTVESVTFLIAGRPRNKK